MSLKREILAVNLDTGERKTYGSLTKASADLGISYSKVSEVASGKYRKARNYVFFYDDDNLTSKIVHDRLEDAKRVTRPNSVRVRLTDITTGEVKNFPAITEAGKALGITTAPLLQLRRTGKREYRGYKVAFLDSQDQEIAPDKDPKYDPDGLKRKRKAKKAKGKRKTKGAKGKHNKKVAKKKAVKEVNDKEDGE